MIFPDLVIKLLEPALERRLWYREYYLQSNHWRRFKARATRHYGNKCARCFRYGINGVMIDVHHQTYERLWHERLEDVQLLCRECHKKRH